MERKADWSTPSLHLAAQDLGNGHAKLLLARLKLLVSATVILTAHCSILYWNTWGVCDEQDDSETLKPQRAASSGRGFFRVYVRERRKHAASDSPAYAHTACMQVCMSRMQACMKQNQGFSRAHVHLSLFTYTHTHMRMCAKHKQYVYPDALQHK